jgi:hypothetical protein
MKFKKLLLIISLVVFLSLSATVVYSQETFTEFQAIEFLKEIGLRQFIQDVGSIVVTRDAIVGEGGGMGDPPIEAKIGIENVVILDDCAKGSVSIDRTIIIKANVRRISAVYGNIQDHTFLVIGRDIKHIANSLNKKLKRIRD